MSQMKLGFMVIKFIQAINSLTSTWEWLWLRWRLGLWKGYSIYDFKYLASLIYFGYPFLKILVLFFRLGMRNRSYHQSTQQKIRISGMKADEHIESTCSCSYLALLKMLGEGKQTFYQMVVCSDLPWIRSHKSPNKTNPSLLEEHKTQQGSRNIGNSTNPKSTRFWEGKSGKTWKQVP